MGRRVMDAAGFAALAALAMGLASACQHHAVRQVGHRAFLHPGLVLALVRRPWWAAGVAASAVGVGLQVAALAAGSIVGGTARPRDPARSSA